MTIIYRICNSETDQDFIGYKYDLAGDRRYIKPNFSEKPRYINHIEGALSKMREYRTKACVSSTWPKLKLVESEVTTIKETVVIFDDIAPYEHFLKFVKIFSGREWWQFQISAANLKYGNRELNKKREFLISIESSVKKNLYFKYIAIVDRSTDTKAISRVNNFENRGMKVLLLDKDADIVYLKMAVANAYSKSGDIVFYDYEKLEKIYEVPYILTR